MVPPKAKLHSKSTGKLRQNYAKTPESVPSTSSTTIPSVPVGITPAQEEQFQVELCWCVRQLQMALLAGKFSDKQVKEYTKSLNVLTNPSKGLIEKRKVMRLSFGDYRIKMAEEEKKAKKITLKLTAGGASDKSQFLKKRQDTNAELSDNSFRFNF